MFLGHRRRLLLMWSMSKKPLLIAEKGSIYRETESDYLVSCLLGIMRLWIMFLVLLEICINHHSTEVAVGSSQFTQI
jgi:hypothetical protein